ncbi:MAG: Cytochrome-c3 hydrogenase subunit gamma, partial [Thermococcales archaeon 44_46]
MTVPRPVPRSNTFAEDNPYALERVRVLRVYQLTELEKL